MKTIAVINQKGGVGKTAIAYNMAYCLHARENKTLLVDLDPSANATKGLNISNDEIKLSTADLMTKKLPSFLEINAYDKNFFVIPAKINLALAQREIQGKTYRESILSKQLNRLKEIDYCVIDCSPTLSDLTVNAIYAADILLVPIAYEDDALEGLADLFTVIGEVKEHHNYEFKILRNKKDPRKSKTNIYIENKLLPFYSNGTLLRTIIRQDEQFNQAKIERKTIFHYAPHSNGAEDINKLTTELFP